MRAYVQKLLVGDPSFLNFENTAYWFKERDFEVIRFDYPQLCEGFLDKWLLKYPEETVVAGGVKSVQDALHRADRAAPEIPSFPDSLRGWVKRKYWATTFGEVWSLVKKKSDALPIHIKPLENEKLFTGRVVQQEHDLIRIGDVEEAEPILAQECVEFVSEWRAYVLRNQVVGVFHYRGEPLHFPRVEDMSNALSAFSDAPIACSMDWGVTADGSTELVEVNDGVALGNYGLNGHTYTKMIEARWRELMGLRDYGSQS